MVINISRVHWRTDNRLLSDVTAAGVDGVPEPESLFTHATVTHKLNADRASVDNRCVRGRTKSVANLRRQTKNDYIEREVLHFLII